jgi:hypothetical protein
VISGSLVGAGTFWLTYAGIQEWLAIKRDEQRSLDVKSLRTTITEYHKANGQFPAPFGHNWVGD